MTMTKFNAVARRTFLAGLAGLAGLGSSGILKGSQAWSFSTTSFQPFSFAFVTGCHLVTGTADSFRLTQESQLFLQDAVQQLNALNPDFVIFGGDQVDLVGHDEINWQLFIDIVQSLNCPWHFILGERDASGYPPVDKLRTFGRDWRGKGITADNPFWSDDILPGVHLIGLDTSCANSTIGDLSQQQLNWLAQDLALNKNPFTIVAAHHPLLAPAQFNGGSLWDAYGVPQAAAARAILNSSPSVKLVLSGHVYANNIQREKDIWYVSSCALDVFPCSFRLFRVDSEGMSVTTHQVSYPALVKKAKVNLVDSPLANQYNNRHPAAFVLFAEGTKSDLNARLPLNDSEP